jgi:hypothetical protein
MRKRAVAMDGLNFTPTNMDDEERTIDYRLLMDG